MSDRIAGAVLALLGLAVALESTTFEVAFITDPVGPKALPLLTAVILAGGGIHLMARPHHSASWPPPTVRWRMLAAVLTCLAYALLLPVIGFVPTTMAAATLLCLLFGGPGRSSVLASGALAVALWAVFVLALGLRLPVGTLFGGP